MVKKKRGRKPKVRDYYEGATGGKRGGKAGEGDRRNEREGEVRPPAACRRQLQRWKNVVPVIYDWLANHTSFGFHCFVGLQS